MELDYLQAKKILDNSSILLTKAQIEKRITELAYDIDQEIEGEIPVFLSVMNGGIFFAAKLLEQIKNPFIVNYLHASRYGDATFGSNHITWYRQPRSEEIKGKTVYVIDDILDEGQTLYEVKRLILNSGAKSCKIVVLVDKIITKAKPIYANHIGLSAPNHFLFGCGMDIFGVYRQLPDIYIYNERSI